MTRWFGLLLAAVMLAGVGCEPSETEPPSHAPTESPTPSVAPVEPLRRASFGIASIEGAAAKVLEDGTILPLNAGGSELGDLDSVAWLSHDVALVLAGDAIYQVSEDELAAATNANVSRIFGSEVVKGL